jgi:toxin CptA
VAAHAATTVIALTFVALFLVGAWSYADVLAELARGMSDKVLLRALLLQARLLGAVLGGWTAAFEASACRPAPSALRRRRRAHGLGQPASARRQ